MGYQLVITQSGDPLGLIRPLTSLTVRSVICFFLNVSMCSKEPHTWRWAIPTTNQLVRKGRKRRKKKRSRREPMAGKPQVRGVVMSVFDRDPSKPNSANRHCARVRLSTGYEVIAHIPGETHNIHEHSHVLVRPASNPDLHGIKFQIIRGALDASSPNRRKSRSRYGVKKP